jgi:hypothetical protein
MVDGNAPSFVILKISLPTFSLDVRWLEFNSFQANNFITCAYFNFVHSNNCKRLYYQSRTYDSTRVTYLSKNRLYICLCPPSLPLYHYCSTFVYSTLLIYIFNFVVFSFQHLRPFYAHVLHSWCLPNPIITVTD